MEKMVEEINLHSTVEIILNDNIINFFWFFMILMLKSLVKSGLAFTHHVIFNISTALQRAFVCGTLRMLDTGSV